MKQPPIGGSGGDAGAGGDVGGSGGGGDGGTSGAAGTGGTGGTGGDGGSAGSLTSNGGTTSNPPQPVPALAASAATLSCPTVIHGVLDTSDARQTGRHSRIAPISACGMSKSSPGTAADSSNPHLFDVYRFANLTANPVCYTFTLAYGAALVVDAGADASPDAGSEPPMGDPNALRYMTAYETFYPTNIALGYRADVGHMLDAPQTMAITVPADDTIDVVVYAIDVAPAGVGSYTLSCSTQ